MVQSGSLVPARNSPTYHDVVAKLRCRRTAERTHGLRW